MHQFTGFRELKLFLIAIILLINAKNSLFLIGLINLLGVLGCECPMLSGWWIVAWKLVVNSILKELLDAFMLIEISVGEILYWHILYLLVILCYLSMKHGHLHWHRHGHIGTANVKDIWHWHCNIYGSIWPSFTIYYWKS